MYRVVRNAVFGYKGKRYELALTSIKKETVGGTKNLPPTELLTHPPDDEVLAYLYLCGHTAVVKDEAPKETAIVINEIPRTIHDEVTEVNEILAIDESKSEELIVDEEPQEVIFFRNKRKRR